MTTLPGRKPHQDPRHTLLDTPVEREAQSTLEANRGNIGRVSPWVVAHFVLVSENQASEGFVGIQL